jgi:hypothetical protein
MKEYHKIQTVFKRDSDNNYRTLLSGQYSLPEFEYLKNNDWIFTEKVDGVCIRVMYDGSTIRFGGKTDNAQIPSSLISRLSDIFLEQIDKFGSKFGNEASVCLYGEGYGNKIQKGGKYRSDQSFVLFDVKIGDWWLERPKAEEIADSFELEIVPVIGSGTLDDMVHIAQKGFNSQWGNFIAEGIVARPHTELRMRSGDRIITKIKWADFKG